MNLKPRTGISIKMRLILIETKESFFEYCPNIDNLGMEGLTYALSLQVWIRFKKNLCYILKHVEVNLKKSVCFALIWNITDAIGIKKITFAKINLVKYCIVAFDCKK